MIFQRNIYETLKNNKNLVKTGKSLVNRLKPISSWRFRNPKPMFRVHSQSITRQNSKPALEASSTRVCCIAWGQITQQRVSLAQLNCSTARAQWQTIHEIHQCSRDPTKKKKAIWKFWRSRHHDFLLRNLSIHASMTPICRSSISS